MAQNTLQISDYTSQETAVSIDRYRENKVSTKFNKPHCIIPVTDMKWVIEQTKIVQTLWNECWASDQFGSRWMSLSTSLSDKSFGVARKILYTSGLFEFKRDTAIDDSRKTVGWLVRNLHGARRIAEFWNKEDPEEKATMSLVPEITDQKSPRNFPKEEITPEIIPTECKKLPIERKKIPIDGKNLPCISPETIENTGVSEPLSISSISSQELLTEEVLEEKKQRTSDEALEALHHRARNGDKTAAKLIVIIERSIKRSQGEDVDEEYYRDLFRSQHRWDIDQNRLQQLLQLNQDCRASFMRSFNASCNYPKTFGSKLFDEIITWVKNNIEEATNFIKRQSEYFDYCMERREQLTGNT